MEAKILELLQERGEGKSVCPSEVARALAGSDNRNAWEPLMEVVRKAAERMAAAGRIEVSQRGRVVDLASAKGPVRLRLRENG